MSSFMFNFCFVVSWILPRLVSHPSIMRLSSPTLPESISLDTLPGWIGILRGPRCSSLGVRGVTVTRLSFGQLSVRVNCYSWEGGGKGNPEGQSQNLCLKTTQVDHCVDCKNRSSSLCHLCFLDNHDPHPSV